MISYSYVMHASYSISYLAGWLMRWCSSHPPTPNMHLLVLAECVDDSGSAHCACVLGVFFDGRARKRGALPCSLGLPA